MATEVVMPKLGLTMERGTIGAWLKQEGDTVARGEPLLEVVTDKVTMEVEAQAGGVLRRILVPAGEEVDVATSIGVIGESDEDVSSFGAAAVSAPEDAAAVPPTVAEPPAPTPTVLVEHTTTGTPAAATARRPHRASPKARRIAQERGIDLATVRGSGPSGRIVSADLSDIHGAPGSTTAATPTQELPTAGQIVDLTRPQQVAAERLTQSYQQAPHIYVEMPVSAIWLQQLREGYAAEGRKVSYNDLILRAVATTLQEQPRLNSHFVDGRVHQQGSVDIGIAADTPQGLLVPVLRNTESRTIDDIAAESRRLIDGARHSRLGIDDLTGGSFTVSNLGMFGVSGFTAIINPPQVAILAVGAIERTVVPVGTDGMAVRPQLRLTLSADHRAIDGAMAAGFLRRLKEILENPGLLG